MRPNTLSETYDRIIDGEAVEKAFAEFLDQFYALTDTDTRSTALAGEPRLTGDAHLDALAGATAEYLAKQYLADVPAWSHGEARSLALPWFTTDEPCMSVDLATVKRVARLARIAVTEEEAERMTGELNGILGFVEQLNEVDVEASSR
jgi:hypothetical protein